LTWHYDRRRKVVVLVLDVFPERREVFLLDVKVGMPFIADYKSDEVLEQVRKGALLEVEIDQYYSFDIPEVEQIRKMSAGILDRAYRLELVSAKPVDSE